MNFELKFEIHSSSGSFMMIHFPLISGSKHKLINTKFIFIYNYLIVSRCP